MWGKYGAGYTGICDCIITACTVSRKSVLVGKFRGFYCVYMTAAEIMTGGKSTAAPVTLG